ncbi:uncharacterized protein PAC_07433 [Phialocephala subalpina]|uniref:Cbs domain-containing protein n=1 Tax=Phialocephala subalpina TaxID=576137 RepID=A0A1L7WXP6_9HELO|nr:uncharacterized protein PAC_07433 [Phialocephala subalpina]
MRLLLKTRRRRKALDVMPMPPDKHKFDDQTGQMFTETTVAMPAQSDINWPYRTGLAASPISAGRRKGARSLVAIALETIMQNVTNLTFDVLEPLPRRLLQQVWEQVRQRSVIVPRPLSSSYSLVARQVIGFHTWRVFSTLLREDDNTLRMRRYREQLRTPNSPLQYYAKPLASTSFDFLTYLSITIAFTVPDLVKLSEMKNLVALEMVNEDGQYQQGVSDRVVRAWTIAATSGDSFRVLRILKLWNFEEITNVSLGYLNLFPALAIYDVTGCSIDLQDSAQALPHGWKATVDSHLLGRLQAACMTRADIMRAKLGKEVKATRKVHAQQLSEDSLVSMLLRTDIPGFLSRDKTATSTPGRAGKTWEFTVYTTICKIGELRNDTDLVRAGIEIEEQPVVENELICPLPIVSLRLGPTPSCLEKSSRKVTTIEMQHLAFTRIKVGPDPILSSADSKGVSTQEGSSIEGPTKRPNIADSRSTSSGESAPAKRRSTAMARKRQDLNAVLDSFL